MALNLGKITLPPQPMPASTVQEYSRNVGIWTREVEQVFRQIERALQGFDGDYASRDDFNALSQQVANLPTSSGSGGGSSVVVEGPQGPPGPTGPPGRDGTDGIQGPTGANGATWYSGAGAPSGGTGSNNDYYLDTTSGNVYKKVAGTWTLQGNLKGPTGPSGSGGSAAAKACRIYKASAQTISSSSSVSVVVPTIQYDTDTMSGVSSRITITTSGYYHCAAQVTWAANASGTRQTAILRGTSVSGPYVAIIAGAAVSTDATRQNCSGTYYLSAGDVIQIVAYQTSTGSLDILSGIDNTWLSAALIGT